MITGGGSGIGRATALLFGQDAARVAVIDCNERSTRETAIRRGTPLSNGSRPPLP